MNEVKHVARFLNVEGGYKPDTLKVLGLVFKPKYLFNESFRFPSARYEMQLKEKDSQCRRCGTHGSIQYDARDRTYKCRHCKDLTAVLLANTYKVVGANYNILTRFIIRWYYKLVG